MRTCVGCRSRDTKEALVRVVRTPRGSVETDASGRAEGRGAYLHPREACLTRAARSRALERALRVRLEADETGRLLGELMGTAREKQ